MKKTQNSSEKSGEKPMFSVVILTYCQRHLLNDCIDSVLKQDYPKLELVICDDCSPDFSAEEVHAYIAQNRRENLKNVVVYQQEKNVGIVRNSQTGVTLSRGTYFKLLAGDDMLYADDTLTKVAKIFEKKTSAVIAGRSIACQYDGEMTQHYYPSLEAVSSMKDASAQRQFEIIGTQATCEFVHGPAVFWRRSFFDRIGGFDLSYTYEAEWPTWLKITGSGQDITIIEDVVTIFRYGGASNDASSLSMYFENAHYDESIRCLREEALGRFEQAGNKKKIVRCKHSIRGLELRKEIELNWESWSMGRQLCWRIKNLGFLALSWLYRCRQKQISTNIRGCVTVMGVCLVLFALHIQILPGIPCDKLWAWGFILSGVLALIKCGISVGMKTMNFALRLANKKG